MDRSSQIIRTSWIGIAANVLLASFKAAVGILASSVAIVIDAGKALVAEQHSPALQKIDLVLYRSRCLVSHVS